MKIRIVALALATFSISAQAQGALPRCAMAEMVVKGAIRGYDAKKQGVNLDQQTKDVKSMADKLGLVYGANVGKTYGDTETRILQSLYENTLYSSMSRQQFDDAMTSAFYHDPSCPQST